MKDRLWARAFLPCGGKRILPELGKMKNAANEKASRVLRWAPRSNEASIVATVESLMRLGLLKAARKKPPK